MRRVTMDFGDLVQGRFSDMSITEVEEEANSLNQSVFAVHDVIELMKQVTGFNCDKITESEALFILNSITTFHYLDPQPKPKGVRFSDQNAFNCIFCTLTGCSSTFEKKSELRQHNRDHFGIMFICAHCDHAERERAGVLKHIWRAHPGEIEEIDSTDFETLIDQCDAMFDDEEEDEVEEQDENPQAAKGLRINLFSCLERSLLEQTTTNRLDFSTLDHSIIEHSILEDTVNEANVSFEDSLIKSIGIDLNSTRDLTTIEHEIRKENKPLIKRIHLNKGNILRVSDQGLTPDRRLMHKKDCRLLKRIYMNEGQVARISDHGLFSPLAKDKQ